MVIPIEAVHRGMGFDEAGRWHEANARYMPARAEADDPLSAARGVISGLLISGALWVGFVAVARFLFHIWR